MPQLLQIKNLCKSYPSAAGPVAILKDLSLDLNAGTTLAIVGPSGSGKSTLLQIIGTLDLPTSGEILLDGTALTGLDGEQLAAIRNTRIGFVFQSHHLLPQCTALENVLVPTLATKRPAAENRRLQDRAQSLLKRVGLEQRLHHRPAQLSGGERQRVAVVRALILEPRLVLADEPTGALDRLSAENLAQLLVELNREQGVTLITVTHSMELARRMDRAMELRDGRLHPVQLQ